ncbi:MAG: hypothetical protein U0802_25985 [Candidatus Binatia bacterium]
MFAAPTVCSCGDSVHDRLYQVDVPSGAVLAAATIQLPADVSWHTGSAPHSAEARVARIVKSQPVLPVSWALATVDPVTTAVDTYGGFTAAGAALFACRETSAWPTSGFTITTSPPRLAHAYDARHRG